MQSEQINELAAALSKAQGEMGSALKDGTNPHFKNRYASLASVWDACREPLSKNGLSVVQIVQQEGGVTFLVSMLSHGSGQWIKSKMPLPSGNLTPQQMGSALTYYRRYSLSALIGVTQDDDDSEAAEASYRRAPAPIESAQSSVVTLKQESIPKIPKEPTLSPEQIGELEQRVAAMNDEGKAHIRKVKPSISGILARDFSKAVAYFDETLEKYPLENERPF